jgi:hypothetical protein
MGIILNPRGTAGSGKTELVRRISARYRSKPSQYSAAGDCLERLHKPGRTRRFAYRLRHPCGGAPLVVIGHYEVTSGGCDTIRAVDGGLKEAARWAASFAKSGHDVVMEGLRLSSDVEHTRALAQDEELQILRLSTPLQQCVRNLVARRRAGRGAVAAITSNVMFEHQQIEAACARLRQHAPVEDLTFDEALARAEALLGLPSAGEDVLPAAS